VAKKPYASVMSRWDPTEPTSQMRRWARRRIALTVQAVLFMVAGISLAVYQVTTDGPSASVLLWVLGLPAIAYSARLAWNFHRYIENYDNARHQGANRSEVTPL
jgi:hypothetical protein